MISLKTFNCECLLGNQIMPSHPLAREKLRKNVWQPLPSVQFLKIAWDIVFVCIDFFASMQNKYQSPCGSQVRRNVVAKHAPPFKVAQYSFWGSIPFTFEHKVRRQKQRFGKIDTTVALDKDENLLWSRLQWHRSFHSNEMTPLPILLEVVFLGPGNCSSKIVDGSFFLQ